MAYRLGIFMIFEGTYKQANFVGSLVVDGDRVDPWLWRYNCSGSEYHMRSCDPGIRSRVSSPDQCGQPVLEVAGNCSTERAIGVKCAGECVWVSE